MERYVIPIIGDGETVCLFNNDEHHREIRLRVVEEINFYCWRFILQSTDFVNFTLGGEYADHVELLYKSIIPKYTLFWKC